MSCCGKENIVNLDDYVHEFPDLSGIGTINWPVLHYYINEDNREPVIMIHSPVGTDIAFVNTKYKVVVSGFCTSLEACANYLKDMFVLKDTTNPNYLEFNHTFNSDALKTNINRILRKIGLFEIIKIKEQNVKDKKIKLLNRIKNDPVSYPILMTQALCCIGTRRNSDAKYIMQVISGNIYREHKVWVENSLNDWLKRITNNKSNKCSLILLGRTSDGKSAIENLLNNSVVNGLTPYYWTKTLNIWLILRI